MNERQAVRRLRNLSTVGAFAIIGVLVIQVVILVTLSLTTLPPSRSVNASGLRRGLTLRILYDGTVHDDADLHRAIAALSEDQGNFADLSPSEETVFERFVAHPTSADGFALFNLFNAKTNAYEAAARTSRARFRIGAIATSLIAIVIALLLYFRLARPAEARWATMVERLDESQERLRALARVASLHAGSVDRQISETLQFAALALELQGALVTRAFDDEVKVVHAVGETLQVGETYPFAESYTRHIFGANKLIAFWNPESNQYLNDPAQARFGWGALITATAFADGVPVGAVSFMSRRPRRRPFEGADLDFVRVVAAMIGASLARERREDELEAIAYVDAVTRLPNRRYGMEQLGLAIARAARSGEVVVVYFIDLDGFKGINDAFGHAIGDEFLAITAARLRAVLREGDVLARVGGDEFLAMQVMAQDDAGALRLGERLIEAASDRAIFEGRSVAVGASVGIAVYPRDASTPEELLERADQAMYASKRAGKGVATLSP
jgi:diguanylate cyclase (GGDEF)-like protein